MTNQEVKDFLLGYVTEEMNLLTEQEMQGYDHEFSQSFQKTMKKMFWSEKYFGKRIRLGYAMRKIAIMVAIIAGLFSVNQVSAKVLGFNPWKYFTSFLYENKMETKEYVKPYEKNIKNINLMKAKQKAPDVVPEGFSQTVNEENKEAGSLYKEWQRGEEFLQYLRLELSSNSSISTDAEYEVKEKMEVCGYAGEICIKGSEVWILWDDANYRYEINATNVKNAKEILKNMAEEIYQ